MNLIREITSKWITKRSVKNLVFQKPLNFQILQNFTILNRADAQQFQNVFDPIQNLMEKQFRQAFLEKTLLEQHKLVIPAKRVRKQEDNIVSLKKNNECAACIKNKDQFPDLDIVLDPQQIRSLLRRQNPYTESYYVNINGEDIRVTLDEVKFHGIEHWIWGAQFNRYIVGRPNKLRIQIFQNESAQNAHVNRGAEFGLQIDEVQVYSYNNDYPTCLVIDPQNASHGRPYQIGDLAQLLPDGMYLTQQWLKQLHANVFVLGADPETMMNVEISNQKLLAQTDQGDSQEEFQQFREAQLESQTQQKTPEKSNAQPKAQKLRSIQQIVAGMSAEQKQKFIG